MKSRIATLIALATTALGLGCGEDGDKDGSNMPPLYDCETTVSDDPTGGLPLKGDCNSPFHDMFMVESGAYLPISEGVIVREEDPSVIGQVFHFHKTCVLGFYDANSGVPEYNDAPPGFTYEERDPKTTYQGIDVKNFPVSRTDLTIDATFRREVKVCEPRIKDSTPHTEEIYYLEDLAFTLLSSDTFKRKYQL